MFNMFPNNSLIIQFHVIVYVAISLENGTWDPWRFGASFPNIDIVLRYETSLFLPCYHDAASEIIACSQP